MKQSMPTKHPCKAATKTRGTKVVSGVVNGVVGGPVNSPEPGVKNAGRMGYAK